MKGDKSIKKNCGCSTEMSTTIYWCSDCNIPIFEKECSLCGKEGEYVSTDIRPVFPEENLLISILLDKDPLMHQKDSVWYGGNSYIINGEKVKLSLKEINKF